MDTGFSDHSSFIRISGNIFSRIFSDPGFYIIPDFFDIFLLFLVRILACSGQAAEFKALKCFKESSQTCRSIFRFHSKTSCSAVTFTILERSSRKTAWYFSSPAIIQSIYCPSHHFLQALKFKRYRLQQHPPQGVSPKSSPSGRLKHSVISSSHFSGHGLLWIKPYRFNTISCSA